MPKKLTQAQIDAYHRDGFVAPIDVFSEDEALRLCLCLRLPLRL